MIVFNLVCKVCNISFEGWFNNTKDFEGQNPLKCCEDDIEEFFDYS